MFLKHRYLYSEYHFSSFFKKNISFHSLLFIFIIFILVALGLCFCAQTFSSCAWGLLSSYCVWASACCSFSCYRAQALGNEGFEVVAHGLSICSSWTLEHGLSICGTQPLFPCGIWNLPGPGIEPIYRDQDHPHGKEMQKSKWLSAEALQIAMKRSKVKSKG